MTFNQREHSPATDEIATTAARLVVEDGLEYAAAKRKAARLLGRRGARGIAMPSNEAVEAEVRDYLAIFCADTQPTELRVLRELGARWMERLAAFRPHLGGAAWRGTATRRSALVIELYCDDEKSAEVMLINAGIPYDIGSADVNDESPPVLTVMAPCPEFGERVPVHFIVHDFDGLRGALRPDAGGRTWRGDLAALRRCLDVAKDGLQ